MLKISAGRPRGNRCVPCFVRHKRDSKQFRPQENAVFDSAKHQQIWIEAKPLIVFEMFGSNESENIFCSHPENLTQVY